MKEETFLSKNKNILYIALGTGFILLIPLVAMQFTHEVDWNLFDFIIAGTLLFGTGLIFELVSRILVSRTHKIVLGIVLAILLFLTWAELAVGVFGTPFAGS